MQRQLQGQGWTDVADQRSGVSDGGGEQVRKGECNDRREITSGAVFSIGTSSRVNQAALARNVRNDSHALVQCA